MTDLDIPTLPEPWVQFENAIARGDTEELCSRIDDWPESLLIQTLGRLSRQSKADLATLLTPSSVARLIEKTDAVLSAPLLCFMPPEDAARTVALIHEDARRLVLTELPSGRSRSILGLLAPEKQRKLAKRMSYLTNSAGALMSTRFVSQSVHATVGEVIDFLRVHAKEYADYEVQYVYILDADRRLQGVLPLRSLLFADPEAQVWMTMIKDPDRCHPATPLETLASFFDEHSFFAIPMVDETGAMIGIVTRKAVHQATDARASSMMLKLHGIVGGEEFRSMPLRSRSVRRLSWLTVNIVLNLLAAGVIILYENTLLRAISLAAFLPIISDMSGNAGNQAVAVSLRELTLKLIRPVEFAYVLLKEASVGLINGVVLGVLIGLMAWVWKGNVWLGCVVGFALAINTLVAVCAGGLMPLLLRRLKVDPALVASPVLTTVTDVSGFLLALGFATLALNHIG